MKRIRTQAYVRGYGQDADDIAQDIAIKLLEGRHKHATVDQMFIDYLRRTYGRPHQKFYQRKLAVKFPIYIEDYEILNRENG